MKEHDTDNEVLSLKNLRGGEVVEQFDAELKRIYENIDDPNTAATAKRTVTLTVTFEPDHTRKAGTVMADVKSKPAPPIASKGRVFFGSVAGELVASEYDPRQGKLFDTTGEPAAAAPEPEVQVPKGPRAIRAAKSGGGAE
jgi:hypothetical protein